MPTKSASVSPGFTAWSYVHNFNLRASLTICEQTVLALRKATGDSQPSQLAQSKQVHHSANCQIADVLRGPGPAVSSAETWLRTSVQSPESQPLLLPSAVRKLSLELRPSASVQSS